MPCIVTIMPNHYTAPTVSFLISVTSDYFQSSANLLSIILTLTSGNKHHTERTS